MTVALTAAAAALAYVLGSAPTGLWLGLRLRNTDIRRHGSCNIGATNTLRVLGRTLGGLALAGDMAKGAAAVLVVARISPWPHAPLLCGMAAILGHTFSLFLRFRGGKGVATSAGVFLSLCPLPTLTAAAVFAVVVGATRMVSLGSICAALTIAGAVFVFHGDPALRGVVVAVAAVVVARHHANIRRILRGEENRF